MVELYFDFIWRSLRRLGVPAAELDDAAQQVFWTASRKLERIDASKERAFLFGTAVRVASDARRSRRRRRETVAEEPPEQLDEGAGPHEVLEQKQLLEDLDEVLTEMPIEQSAVFVLIEIEELEAAQAAALLDIPVGTVASRLRRARREFRDRLERKTKREHPEGRRRAVP